MNYEPFRTSAHPKRVEGVEFHCWQVGIASYIWRSADGKIEAGGFQFKKSYWSSIGKDYVTRRAHTLENAMRRAIKASGQP
jgi:hypothetical protein